MNNFSALFLLELKRFFRKRNIILLLVLLVFLAAFTIVGINEYRDVMDREQKFREIEALNFEKFPNYDIYGDEGISVQYCPGPTGIFFRDMGVSTELIGKVDSHVNLSIFDNYKSKSLFRGMFAGMWSFAGILFIFGSLICLSWAAELLSGKEYLKFLSTLLPRKKVFLFLVFSRLLLITLTLLFIFGSIYMLLLVYSIDLSPVDFAHLASYFIKALFMLFFFFAVGLLIGITRSRGSGFLAIMVIWIVFVFLVPGYIQYIVENRTFGSIKDYQMEIEKFKIIAEFEKRANKEYGGRFNENKLELARKIMESYYNNDYQKIELLENKLKNEMQHNIFMFDDLSLLTPPSIYYKTSIEVSSRGYESFMDFYSYLQELKKKFIRFYIDRFYYNDPGNMINFIKGKENLYFASSRLPRRFGLGIVINLVYIFILLLISYHFYKRSLYRIEEKELERFSSQQLKFENGELKVMKVREEKFKDVLYSLLSGELRAKRFQKYHVNVLLNGQEISSTSGGVDFFYIPNAGAIPGDIKVRNFIDLISSLTNTPGEEEDKLLNSSGLKSCGSKNYGQLDEHKKAEILLAATSLKKSSVYFFFDIALGLSEDFAIPFKERMEKLQQEAAVIYLTTNISVDINIGEKKTGMAFVEHYDWVEMVEHLKSMKKDEK